MKKLMLDRKLARGLWIVSVACAHFVFPSGAQAGAPTEAIRSTSDKVLEILKDPGLKPESKRGDRREKLREVIYPKFDFAEMAKRSLGSHWRQRSPEEQEEFIKLFTSLLESSYVDKVDSYNGEKVLYAREREDKNFAEVDTKIITAKGESFSVNYKLHNANGEWKVYDVVIENISLVNNYRSQFDRVLTRSSFDELLTRMKSKQFQAPATKAKT